MIALVAFLTLLGSARALHNTPAPTPAPSSTDHHHDDDHHVEIAPDDVYPPRARYRHGAPTAEWIPASYQMGEEDFDLAFQASANGIVRVDVWGYLRVYYRRVVDKETFTPYYYLFNNWNPHRNEYGVDYELYSTYTAALNRDDSDDSTPTCNDVKEAFANEPGSFPGKGFPYGCEFMEGDFGYMYKSTGSQVGFDGARALERDPESCSRVMNGTFACDTASAAKHEESFPHGWRVYLESPQPLSERWHPPPDVQFVTLAPNAGVEGEGDLDVAGEVDQFTIRTRARVVEAGKVFALYRTAGTSGTPDPSDPFLVLQARTVDAKTVFELFVDTGVDGCEVTLVTNASWTEPESVDLAVTYDDGAAAVYVDGSLDAMGSMPAECVSPTTKPTQWRLGDAGSGMAGDVNFLTVWSRTALAPWRVRRAALADYSHVPPPDHHFNFDEPPGTTEVTNSIDNGRRSSASLDPGCEIVGVHDGSLAQLDTPLAVLDADVHVHVPWTSKLAKVFQGSFSMQMWVKPGGDVEEDVELNIFGNYDVSDPEYGDCSCACDGKPVANGTINVTDDQGAMGVTSRQCAAAGLEECGDMVTDGVIDACPGGVDFTAVWSYNQSYTGANFDDGDGDDGMLFGDCGCLCEGNPVSYEGNPNGTVDVTAFPGYLNGEGVPEAVCGAAGPGYCQMMSAHPAFPACNVNFTTEWRPNNTYSGALYELGDCTCTCDGANMGVLDGCDPSTKAALNQSSRVGCGLYPSECGTACSTIETCDTGWGYTHELVEAYSYGGGDWGGGGGGGRKLLSHDDDQAYEYDPAENYVRLYLQKLTNDTYAVKMEIRSGVGTQPMTLTGDNVTADEWYHFALERDVSRGTLGYYLNGIKRSDLDIGTEALTNGKNANLLSSMLDNGLGIFAAGARSVNSSVNFSASFSDFMIYSDAVGSSFPAGPGMCSTPWVDNLIMWLPLDNMDASDHSTVDASGYHHRAFVRGSFVYEPTPVATWNYAEHRLVSSWTSPQNDIKIVKDRSAAPCRPWAAEEGCDEPVPLDCSSCLSSMGFDTGECGLKAIGGEISFADGYTIHTFKESGTFTILQLGIKNLEVFAVGGGGGGGKLEEIDDLQGCEVVCDGHGYDQFQCEDIVGCRYDDGECWSAVGPNPCDSGSTSTYHGDCECLCETAVVGDGGCSGEVGVPELCHINVTGDISGKGIPEDACSVHGPGVCDIFANASLLPQCNGTNFTTKWSYNSTYTGAVWSDDEDSTDSGSGGGAECRCYCGSEKTQAQYAGYVNGITSEQCIQDGPTSTAFGCPGSESYFSQTCDTYYVEYVANPGGTTGRKLMQGSGPTPAPSPSFESDNFNVFGVQGGAGGYAGVALFGDAIPGTPTDMYEFVQSSGGGPMLDFNLEITVGEGGAPGANGSDTVIRWDGGGFWGLQGGVAGTNESYFGAGTSRDGDTPDGRHASYYTIRGNPEAFSGGGAGCQYWVYTDESYLQCGTASGTGGDAQAQKCSNGACDARSNTGGGGGGLADAFEGEQAGRGGSGVVIIRYKVDEEWAKHWRDVERGDDTPPPETVPKVGIKDGDFAVWRSGAALSMDRFTADDEHRLPSWAEHVLGTVSTDMRDIEFITDKDVIVRMYRTEPSCDLYVADMEGFEDGRREDLDWNASFADGNPVEVYERRFPKGTHHLDASTSFYQFFTPSNSNHDMLFGDCRCLCEGDDKGAVDVTAFPGYLNGSGVPEAVCGAAGPGYCQMMSAHPAFPACNVNFTTEWVTNDTYSGALYELGDCTCTCDGANMGVLDGCDSSTKAALNQSRVGCGLYPSECGTACLTIGTCESASSVDATHALVEAYSYGGGDWGGGGGGRKLLSQNPGDTYEPQPAALQSAEIVPDRRVTGRFVKLTQHSGDSMVVAELHVFRENFGSTLSIDADLALNKKVTGTEPVGRYVKVLLDQHIHLRQVVVFDPTDASVNLALNKPATADSYIENYVAGNVVDGSLGTFSHTSGGNSWLEIDLEDEMPIGGIYIANLCDGVMSDPHWCSDSWNSAWNMENWQYMNNRVVEGGLKVQILDSDKNVVIESASPTQSSRAYIFAWNYRQFGMVINLDTQDDSWKGSLNHQKLVDGDHSPAMLLAGTTIVDLGEETEIDGVFIVGDYDVVASKPKSLVTGSMAGFSCSVLNDGTLKCWGWNRYGQLGIGADGNPTSRSTPTAVNLGAGRTAKVVSLGSSHTCAILDDDTLKCWGANDKGQLGIGADGNPTSRSTPTAVNLGAGRTAKAVAAGSSHTCAILDDGTLKCWGYNNWGQLGYGDKTSRNAPDATEVVNLGPGRTAKAVAAGGSFTCAILDDGTIKCWGAHQGGAVGDGTIPTAPNWGEKHSEGGGPRHRAHGEGFVCRRWFRVRDPRRRHPQVLGCSPSVDSLGD
jgi:hypothetical protein